MPLRYRLRRFLARHRIIRCRVCKDQRVMTTDGAAGLRDLALCSWCGDGRVIVPGWCPAVTEIHVHGGTANAAHIDPERIAAKVANRWWSD